MPVNVISVLDIVTKGDRIMFEIFLALARRHCGRLPTAKFCQICTP